MMSVALVSLAVTSLWISVSTVEVGSAAQPPEANQDRVVVFVGGDEQAGKHHGVVWTTAEDENNDGRSEKRIVRLRSEEPGDAEERGWLGVSISSTSNSDVEDSNGIEKVTMVVDVVKDSPADRAGLAANDVIVSIGGENISGDVGKLVQLVSAHKPGEQVEVIVLRDGAEKTFVVELGSRAESKSFQWKFDLKPFGEMKEKIRAHAHVLRPGEDGALVLEELGDLQDLEVLRNLPHSIRAFIPDSDDRTVQVWVNKDQKQVKKIVHKIDGRTVEISQEDEGEITVRRTDEAGQETVATFADEEALKAGDEEAYGLFHDSGGQASFQFEWEADGTDESPRLEFKFDTGEWHQAIDQWRSDLEAHLSEAHAAHQEAMKSLHEAIEQWKSGQGPALPSAIERLPEILGQLDVHQGVHQFARARYSFRVDEEGKIEARLRKGDSEIVRSFSNEEDLAARDTELYEKYKNMMAADEQ